MKFWTAVVFVLVPTVFCFGFDFFAAAQTITVDVSHSSNHFVPSETLGAGVDRISAEAIDKDLLPSSLETTLSSGWQTVSYRQNTELAVEAWHWNPQGSWSDASGKGYFTGSAVPTETLRYSYGYPLPRRGFTRNDGTDNTGFSRLTDGDLNTFWKSNPYLTQHFTGESDALHPQWIVLDLAQPQPIDSIRIAWGEPYATRYAVQYWTGDDPIKSPTRGVWQTFTQGGVDSGKGRTETTRLSAVPVAVRFVRIWMTESSNTCDGDGSCRPAQLCWILDSRTLPGDNYGSRMTTVLSTTSCATLPIRSRRPPTARRLIPGIKLPTSVQPAKLRWASTSSIPAESRADFPP